MKKILIILSVFVGGSVFAQQQATYTNFLMNSYYYNPAIAGSNTVHTANLSYRNQWAGFEGAPVTIMANFYGSYRNKGKMGYGLAVISDKTGLTNCTGAYVNYAQHFKLGNKMKLGFGIRPGYIQYRVKLYDAKLADQGDEILTGNVLSVNAIDLNGGLHLYSEKFFFMASASQILGEQVKFTTYNAGLAMHYQAIGGININCHKKKAKKTFVLQPSFLLKYTEPVPLQWTAMVKGDFNKKFWAGLAYRSDDAASICLGYNIKNRLNIGYAFDYSMSKISAYQSGSHEVVISFVLTKPHAVLIQKDEELNNSIMDEMKKKHEKELEKGKEEEEKKE
ncbi:MAG TPA: type IX secretion system membrane protein PorP/SprF [Flavobacteriales bacterium]|nr:type IX secretion system membrane protein PorP/SprF [Flavobacteriales bacterium]